MICLSILVCQCPMIRSLHNSWIWPIILHVNEDTHIGTSILLEGAIVDTDVAVRENKGVSRHGRPGAILEANYLLNSIKN